MIQLRVHQFSVPLLRAYHGGDVVRIKRFSSLYQALTLTPRIVNNTLLEAHIHIAGTTELLNKIQPEAGHTLYRMHTDMMLQWMYAHMLKGQEPYSAMVEFYTLFGITEDDMPHDTAYKAWQRWILKKNENKSLYLSPVVVHNLTKAASGRKAAILDHLATSFQAYALDMLHNHPLPSDYMVRRFLMRTLFQAGWTQEAVADTFGCSQQLVSYHISRR